jgi:hypothetical protein
MNSTFRSNAALLEAGAFLSYRGLSWLYGVKFSNNIASNGGAIYVKDPGVLIGVELEIEGNGASGNGGGVHVDGGTLRLHESRLTNNTALSSGGCINLENGARGTVTNSWIVNNRAVVGGGVNLLYDCQLSLNNCLFAQNQATKAGPALYCSSSRINITAVQFSTNTIVEETHNNTRIDDIYCSDRPSGTWCKVQVRNNSSSPYVPFCWEQSMHRCIGINDVQVTLIVVGIAVGLILVVIVVTCFYMYHWRRKQIFAQVLHEIELESASGTQEQEIDYEHGNLQWLDDLESSPSLANSVSSLNEGETDNEDRFPEDKEDERKERLVQALE